MNARGLSLTALSAGFALLTIGCTESAPPNAPQPDDLPPPPEGQGFQVGMDAVAQPGEEVWLCDVYPLPTEETANVNRVEVRQNADTHHLTLSTLGLFGGSDIPYGRYPCEDLYGDSSLMENQIMVFGSQGVPDDLMQLPDGVAASLPAGLDMIHEIHYVNTTAEPVELYSRVNAWTIEPEKVESGIWGGTVRDENINIPPMAKHTEWSRCLFNEDVEVLFLASHTHALGVEFSVRPFDGTTVGDTIYTNTDWHVPGITQYEPSISIRAGEGFEWSCSWDNTTGDPVGYGNTAADEMCNLAVVHTPFSVTARCEVVETSDGVLWDPDAG